MRTSPSSCHRLPTQEKNKAEEELPIIMHKREKINESNIHAESGCAIFREDIKVLQKVQWWNVGSGHTDSPFQLPVAILYS